MRQVAWMGLAIVAFLLLSAVSSATGTTDAVERVAAPIQLLVVVAAVSLLYSWCQAMLLVTRDRLLLKRQRSDWIVALALAGPLAGAVFILWYARRTRP